MAPTSSKEACATIGPEMSIIERLGAFLKRTKEARETAKRKIEIAFWDLRGPEEAKKKGVKPGFYFTVGPISEDEFRSPDLIPSLIVHFYEALFAENLVSRSDTKIPLDNHGRYTDPASAWMFREYGYLDDCYFGVVRAEPANPQKARVQAIKAIKDKKYTVTVPFSR